MRVFNLPDLGEGLPDAEIVEWFVAEGDHVYIDQPMVSMETAKAVVEVPSPFTGIIRKLHGQAGDVIETGAPLISFDPEEGEQTDEYPGLSEADADTSGSDEPAPAATEENADGPAEEREDTGTVVGEVETSDRVVAEAGTRVGDYRVSPAVRALARKLRVDLATVRPSVTEDVITAGDVRRVAQDGPDVAAAPVSEPATPTPAPAPAAPAATGEWTPVRGPRRIMARAMAEAHAAVVPTSITEDVDVALWEGKQDITVRMIRALCAGVRREPGLNAWFDADGPRLLQHENVHVGIAVDTPDGLFVSTLRNADVATPAELRQGIDRLRTNVENRSIPPEDLSGYSMILSNVGVYAGRYTTPVITPPCVAILATGRMRSQPVASHGGLAVHPVIPVSLTFDHRAVTGGEAARFLAAFMEDLTAPR